MMRGGGAGGRGRGRFRRDYSPRMEEKGGYPSTTRSNVPPSRHLWVGNLSPHITQTILSEHFFRYGELESIIFLPGRNYAFVNYKREEEAVLAKRSLQGVVVAGMPLRIDFQKGDKSSSLLDGDYAYNRDDRYSIEREVPFEQRDSRLRSPENSKSNRSAEPSEVLWIGFPAFLEINEMIIRRAFSPFGELEKISAFRTYAFVKFRSVVAACRAKEALQGRLFNNPRVSICFARNDLHISEHGRELANISSRPNELIGEAAQLDGNFDNSVGEFHVASSRFFSDMEKRPRGSHIIASDRNNFLEVDVPGHNVDGAYESTRFPGLGSESRMSENPYKRHRDIPLIHQDILHHDHLVERTQRGTHFEHSRDMGNDASLLAKKTRTESFSNQELPEYPFRDSVREKDHAGPRQFIPDLAECQPGNRNFETMPFQPRGPHEQLNKLTHPPENDGFRRANTFDAGPGLMDANTRNLQMRTPETHLPLNKEWKWEGTIAKGGTPICRARCFPVGKVLDVMLPEFLDCTARTGLDVLSRHFYLAASSWVVFFVPESDADIVFYNEFMHYLGEKQRAAIAKLGDKTTLFLVPPSEFSEQVLKVPGKVSISGVILSFQQETSNFGALHHPLDGNLNTPYKSQATNRFSFQDDLSQRRLHDQVSFQGQGYINSSSENLPSSSFPTSNRPPAIIPYPESKNDQLKQQNPSLQTNLPSYNLHPRNPNVSENPMMQEHPLSKQVNIQETNISHYPPMNSESLLQTSSNSHQLESKQQVTSNPAPSLRPEQLAQLTALIEQQKRLGKEPVLPSKEDYKQVNPLDRTASQSHASATNQSAPQFDHSKQIQQLPSSNPLSHQAVNAESCGSQQPLISRNEEPENDPQKRLQATLQLAAALLQQIQHQSKNDQQ